MRSAREGAAVRRRQVEQGSLGLLKPRPLHNPSVAVFDKLGGRAKQHGVARRRGGKRRPALRALPCSSGSRRLSSLGGMAFPRGLHTMVATRRGHGVWDWRPSARSARRRRRPILLTAA